MAENRKFQTAIGEARKLRDAAWRLIDRAREAEAAPPVGGKEYMTIETAVDISNRLTATSLVVHGIKTACLPSLADVSLNQAIEAMELVWSLTPARNADGSTTLHVKVPIAEVPRLYAFNVSRHAAGGAP